VTLPQHVATLQHGSAHHHTSKICLFYEGGGSIRDRCVQERTMTDQHLRLECLKMANSLAQSVLGKQISGNYNVIVVAETYYAWVTKPRPVISARDEAA
jgi:hypothetical protein